MDLSYYYGLWNTELILCRIIIRANRRTKVLDLVVTNDTVKNIETRIVATEKIVAKIVTNEQMENQENKNQQVRKFPKNQLELDRQTLLDLHLRLILKNTLADKFKLSRKNALQHQRKNLDHHHR